MNTNSFNINIRVLDGDPNGTRIIERSHWIGKAVVFSRSTIEKVRALPEYDKPGVYILSSALGEAGSPTIYIGEGEPVRNRIESHYAGTKKKDFWTWGLFFISKDDSLNKSRIGFLEAELIRIASEAKKSSLDNEKKPKLRNLSESERIEVDGFLANMLEILPLLGIHIFVKPPKKVAEAPIFFVASPALKASGYETPSGFVVHKGSTAVATSTQSLQPSIAQYRINLLSEGLLETWDNQLRFTEDHLFSSPSFAASLLLGTPTNGRIAWRDAEGRSMNDLAQLNAPGA